VSKNILGLSFLDKLWYKDNCQLMLIARIFWR